MATSAAKTVETKSEKTDKIPDWYVKRLLISEYKELELKSSDLPQEIIETKRLLLQIKRKIKQVKNNNL